MNDQQPTTQRQTSAILPTSFPQRSTRSETHYFAEKIVVFTPPTTLDQIGPIAYYYYFSFYDV